MTDEDTPEMEEARGWLPAVEREWEALGIVSHPDKKVDELQGEEIPGAYFPPVEAHAGTGA